LQSGSAFDVETTCRDWFDVTRRDPDAQKFRSQQRTRPLSEVELLAKIYYNRGVSRLEARSFGNAIALLRTSHALDPADLPTRANMAAGINNWALAEADAGNFERAVELIRDGSKEHPEFEPFSSNDVHIHQRWAVSLCEAGRFAEAMQALHAAHSRRPEVPLFDRGRLAVFGQWSAALLERGDFAEASHLFEQAGNWFDERSEIIHYRSIAIHTAATRLAHSGHKEEANELLRWGLELDPSDRLLQELTSHLTTATL
jgi:tetratricopeptide (TPR) repeat protein